MVHWGWAEKFGLQRSNYRPSGRLYCLSSVALRWWLCGVSLKPVLYPLEQVPAKRFAYHYICPAAFCDSARTCLGGSVCECSVQSARLVHHGWGTRLVWQARVTGEKELAWPRQTGRYDLHLKCPLCGLLLHLRVPIGIIWACGSLSQMSALCCIPLWPLPHTIPLAFA